AVAGRAGDVGHCASLGVSGRSASVERRATFVAQVSVTCQGQLGRAGEPLGTATPRTRARPAPERAATRLRWAGRWGLGRVVRGGVLGARSVPGVGLGDEGPVVERGTALPARSGHVLDGGVVQAECVANLVAGGVGEEIGVPGAGVEDDRGAVT